MGIEQYIDSLPVDKILLACTAIFVSLNNDTVKEELETMKSKRRFCIDKNHFLIKKLIIFSVIYMHTKDFRLAAGVTLFMVIVNHLI